MPITRPPAAVYRVRLDAQGPSATEVEAALGAATDTIQKGLGVAVHVVGQVIEMAGTSSSPEGLVGDDDTPGPWMAAGGTWFRGRRNLAPDIGFQYEQEGGYFKVGAAQSL